MYPSLRPECLGERRLCDVNISRARWNQISRLRAAWLPRLGSLYPPPMNHVFGIFRRDTGQGEVELDFRNGVFNSLSKNSSET